MSDLTRFIEYENRWSTLRGAPLLTIPINKKECEPLFESLEYSLSPENLHCDGEISRAEVNRKYTFLMKVWNMLEHIQDEKRDARV